MRSFQGSSDELVSDLRVDGSGEILMCGDFQSDVDLLIPPVLSANGGGDAFAGKWLSFPTGVNRRGDDKWSVFPNPVTNDRINVYVNEFNFDKATIHLTDVRGQEIKTDSFFSSPNRLEIHPRDLIPGIYFLTIVQTGSSLVRKLIVQ